MKTTQDLINDYLMGDQIETPVDAVQIARIERIQAIKINPGDVLILKCNKLLSSKQYTSIRDAMAAAFPDNKCFVVNDCIEDIQVIGNGQSENDARDNL